MFFKIIFFILFLVGVSLFISTIATLILKKRSKRIGKTRTTRKITPTKSMVTEASERARDYRKEYLDRVSEVSKTMPQQNIYPEERAFEQKTFVPPYEKKIDLNKIKWVFIIIVIVGVLFSGALFGIKYYKTYSVIPKLYLCEGVDFIKLKPVKSSNRFTRGNVTVFFKSKFPIKQKYLSLEVYKLGEAGFVPYAKKKITIKPEWTSFVATILFDQIGNYIVEIKSPDGKLVAQKLVEIVPDSYAYKAKPKYVP